RDPSYVVRLALARNLHTTSSLLELLAGDSDARVAKVAAARLEHLKASQPAEPAPEETSPTPPEPPPESPPTEETEKGSLLKRFIRKVTGDGD
ncbi:MAG: hypothetical protein IJJ26_02870, partial [Victivallales bacterium]|nr:hypothetical protein [Victivallales bacterium]